MYDLKRLLIFSEVVRQGSLSKAATDLHYSQSAISHQIACLERDVGAQLLIRRSNGVGTTDAGHALFNYTVLILDRVREAERGMAEVTGLRSEIRLGSFPTANASIGVDAIASVKHLMPDLEITLLQWETLDTLDGLANGTIDIGIVFDDPENPLPERPELEIKPLLSDPMVLALPVTHRAARDPMVKLESLKDESWIGGAGAETQCTLLLEAACRAVGYEPTVSFHSGDYQVVLELVAAGIGIALVPSLALGRERPAGVMYREVEPPAPSRRLSIVTRRDTSMTGALSVVAGALQRTCEVWAESDKVPRRLSWVDPTSAKQEDLVISPPGA